VVSLAFTRSRWFKGASSALLTLGLLAGFSSAKAAQAPAQPIVVGTTPLVSSAPLFLAQGLGYWKKLGLDVQFNISADAGTIDVATAANSYDVSATGLTASLFNLWNSGKREYIVADKGRIWPGQQFEALVASDKAYKAGLTSIKYMKGKSFGDTSVGSTFDYLLGTMLQRDGLSISDVNDTPLHTVPNLVSAVMTGQVDAAILPQPAANLALASKKVHLLTWVDSQVKADLLVIAYSPNFVKNKPEGVKFMEGYLEAVQYYMQHVYHNHNLKDPALTKALNILSGYVHQPAKTIMSELIYVNPTGAVDAANAQNQVNFYVANHYVTQSVNVNSMIDDSFRIQALALLHKKHI